MKGRGVGWRGRMRLVRKRAVHPSCISSFLFPPHLLLHLLYYHRLSDTPDISPPAAERSETCPARGSHCPMMLSRKSSIFLSSYSPFPSLCYSPSSAGPGSATSCRMRTYAQHASSDLSWPDAIHPHKTPTPYQILDCKRGDTYTKHRFYSLVKLYHPDRAGSSSPVAHLPRTIRLERYRLLVAAHTILADDAKRRAYDAWGHGWTGHHQTPSQTSAHNWAPEQRQWAEGHDPIHNATWEDWERWYRRESGAPDEPRDMYMTNVAFVALVMSIVSLGGIVQGTRASNLTSSVMERRDKIHREACLELARSKHATMSGDRDERIRTFLQHREATHAGEYAYQRILPPAETCASDTVRK
jgi:curved DNA-binding protein CbpA